MLTINIPQQFWQKTRKNFLHEMPWNYSSNPVEKFPLMNCPKKIPQEPQEVRWKFLPKDSLKTSSINFSVHSSGIYHGIYAASSVAGLRNSSEFQEFSQANILDSMFICFLQDFLQQIMLWNSSQKLMNW